MHPANQHMDPYHSYCRDHTPYPYYPPPRWEAGHPRMAMDSSCRPPSYGPWPYSGSTSHSCPPEFHSCCNHAYPPGYYSFRPPFSQELPSPYLYYHGPFPHHLNAYPSYFVPPSPYPVDQATYDYEKFKSHCCGCPNHICHGGEKSKLKIEEEMPEVKPQSDLKGANDSSIICHPNDQYPVMWLPYGNMKDKGNGRSSELPPQLFSRWVPEGGEQTRDMKRQEEDNQKAKQFQWPIIWMPAGYDEPKQEAKRLIEMDKSPKISEDAPPSPKIKVIPLSCFEKGNQDQGPSIKDRSGDHSERLVPISQPASTKHRDGLAVDGNVKTIPVVPEEPNNEKEPVGQNKTISVVPDRESDEKKIGGTYRTIPVVNEKEINEKKSDNKEGKKTIDAEREGEKGEGKNVGSSKAKPSKLPPVCLRVDPLPRKKSGNGCSRSPSLPNSKDVDKDKKGVKQTLSQNLDTKLSDPKKEINMAEVNEKSPGEMEKIMGRKNATVQDAPVKHTQQEQTLQDASTKHTQVEQIPTSTVDQKVQAAVNIETQENASVNPLQECDKTTTEDEMKIQGEAAKFARRREIYLSEPDAAVHIQSAYRGYHVRRWQPVEKLRKIKKVHEQMQDMKKQLQDLEAASSQPMVKEQVALNETIMNLLLELDTIQGSHPSVREARKSVARELICLQEKLDSLCKQPFGDCNHSNSEKASEEEKYEGVCEEPSLCSINSKELMHHEVLPSISELRQDADFAGQKHRMEESSTPKEEAHDEGKAVATGECEGASLMDVMCGAALSGHSTEQKHQMEESNTISTKECPDEGKAAANGVGSSEHYMEPLHDPASSEGPSMLKRCTSVESSALKQDGAPTAEDQSKELKAPFIHLEDSSVPLENAEAHENDSVLADTLQGSTDQTDETAEPLVGDENNMDHVTTANAEDSVERDQSKEPKAPFIHLEDSSVPLENEEPHENDPVLADTSQGPTDQTDGTTEPSVGDENNMDHVTAANAENSVESSALKQDGAPTEEDRSKEPKAPFVHLEDSSVPLENAEAHEKDLVLADTTQGLTDQTDGTTEPSVGDGNNMDHVSSAIAENTVKSPLLKETSQSDSAVEEIVPLESCTIGKQRRDRLAVPLESKGETMEGTLCVAGTLSNMVAEITLPESESSELPCEHDSTGVLENPESKVSTGSQYDTQKECASGDKTSDGMEASDIVKCKEMLEEAPICAAGASSAELEADSKEDVGLQTASGEAAPVSVTHVDLKKGDDKELAEENQKLKEMLQKLLASGNDQMGVITELTEKVKTLERKLARKKRPKVRVHRPARDATAKGH